MELFEAMTHQYVVPDGSRPRDEPSTTTEPEYISAAAVEALPQGAENGDERAIAGVLGRMKDECFSICSWSARNAACSIVDVRDLKFTAP